MFYRQLNQRSLFQSVTFDSISVNFLSTDRLHILSFGFSMTQSKLTVKKKNSQLNFPELTRAFEHLYNNNNN